MDSLGFHTRGLSAEEIATALDMAVTAGAKAYEGPWGFEEGVTDYSHYHNPLAYTCAGVDREEDTYFSDHGLRDFGRIVSYEEFMAHFSPKEEKVAEDQAYVLETYSACGKSENFGYVKVLYEDEEGLLYKSIDGGRYAFHCGSYGSWKLTPCSPKPREENLVKECGELEDRVAELELIVRSWGGDPSSAKPAKPNQ